MNRYGQISILREEGTFSVVECCDALGVSRSGYHAWLRRPPSSREMENRKLAAAMHDIRAGGHEKAYGSPRMTGELRERGLQAGKNRVARLMRKEGIRAKAKRPFRPRTTIRDNAAADRIAPNRLAELGEITAPGQALAGDITYIPTREGWLYLAVVIDLFSRHVLGWSISGNLATPVVTGALRRALRRGHPLQTGAIFHSDRGCQYTSTDYAGELAGANLLPSMSAKGNCYDNATCESFFATLKAEGFPDGCVFDSKAEARLAIFDYIESFYNRRRKHSSLGYKSPDQYLQDYRNALN